MSFLSQLDRLCEVSCMDLIPSSGAGEFELVNGSRDGSEEELVFVDHVDVVSSMEQVHHQENIVEEIEDAINWGSFVSANMENK
jgi:hypothetical protein